MASHSALQAAGSLVLTSKTVHKRTVRTPAAPASPAVLRQRIRCTRMVQAAAGDDAASAVAEPAPAETPRPTAAPETATGDAAPRSFSSTGGGRGGRGVSGRDAGGRGGRGFGGRGGRGPRPAPTVSKEQIVVGAKFDGTIVSLQAYGAFVDFGADSNGLVHISQVSDSYVSSVSEAVKTGQKVRVRVMSIAEGRISLSMKSEKGAEGKGSSDGAMDDGDARPRLGKVAKRGGGSSGGGGNKRPGRPEPKVKAGETITGTVQRTVAYGAFLDLEDGTSALLHINSMSNPDNLDNPQPRQLVKDGQKLQVRVLSVNKADGKIDVTQQTEEEAKMDADLSKGVGTVEVGDNASPFAWHLARAGVQKSSYNSKEKDSEQQSPKESNGAFASVTAAPAQNSPAVNQDTPAMAKEQASPALSEGEASSGASGSPQSKSGATEQLDVEAQLSATGQSAGAAAEAGVAAPAVAEEVSAQPSAAKADSSAWPKQGKAEQPASEGQLAAAGETAGAAAEAGVIAPAAAEEGSAAAPVEAPAAVAPKAESSELPAGAASSEATTPDEQLGDDAPATKTQLAAAGETPAAAEPQQDATPSDAEAHKKAKDGATHLQAAAAGEEAEKKAPTSEAPVTSQPASSPEEARVAGLAAAEEPEQAAAAAPDSGAGEGAESGETGQPGDATVVAPPQETGPQKTPDSGNPPAGEGASSQEEGKPGDVNEAGAPSSSAGPGGLAGVVQSAAQVVADAAPEPVATMASAAAGSAAAGAAFKGADASPTTADSAPKAAADEPAPAAQEAAPASKPAGISAKVVKELRDKTGAGMMDCKKALTEASGDFKQALEALRVKGLAQAGKKADRIATEGLVATYIHAGAKLGVLVEVNCETDFVARSPEFNELVSDIAMQVAATQEAGYVSVEDVPQSFVDAEKEMELQKEDIQQKPESVRTRIVEGRVAKTVSRGALLEQPYIRDTTMLVSDVVTGAVAKLGENIKVRRFERYVLGEGIEKKEVDLANEVEEQKAAVAAQAAAEAAAAAAAPAADAAAPAEDKPKIQIAASMVKELRQQSGAGMMDCKAALQEAGGDTTAAAEILRKKGLASAGKKAGRIASEGRIGSYIHIGSRLGSLIELNCETDFVARGDIFGELLSDLAMQVVSCPDVTVVSVDDVDKEAMAEERRIQLQKEDIMQKPESIRERMVEGRLSKFAKEAALLEQPFIKDNNVSVGDAIKSVIAEIGENIKIRRFERFTLGEGMEKKNDDFAAEVAAQMAGQ